MNILGIYASPRKGGNTDLLLTELLTAAREAGADTEAVFTRNLSVSGCLECGGCDDTGRCVINDEMEAVYPKLAAADSVILASPVFFYNVPARAKALIDRSQALWAARRLATVDGKMPPLKGQGWMIGVGATRGSNLFVGMELTAKYFFDALGMGYGGGLLYWKVEEKGAILAHPEAMDQARELGRKIARGE
ncbi:MAG: flavodoxin family protein [Proteobacteria bacterium]|nr:flavodoxin family protein [Pseudomonadota bacterium]